MLEPAVERAAAQAQGLGGLTHVSAVPLERLADEDALHLLSKVFGETAFSVVEEKPLVFQCGCSWDRVLRALTLVGVDELRSMLKDEGEAIVLCDFCCTEYKLDANGLNELIKKSTLH